MSMDYSASDGDGTVKRCGGLKSATADESGMPDDWDDADIGEYDAYYPDQLIIEEFEEEVEILDGQEADGAATLIAKGLDTPTALTGIALASQERSAAIATTAERPATKGPFKPTDLGNAERFTALHGDNVRYCYAWKSWLVWDGRRWRVDDSGEVMRLAKKTARSILKEAADIESKQEREEMIEWARFSETQSRLNAMIALAQSEQPIPIAVDSLDAEPWLFNCENGTLDLRTGVLRKHERQDFLTKMAALEYPTEAGDDPELWLDFLDTIFASNADLIGFIQRLLGMTLVGEIFENVLAIFHGGGDNGKSVLRETWSGVLGPEYSMSAPDGFLVVGKNDKHPTEIADLQGKRFVDVNETKDGGRLSESLVKRLTSRERIRARRVHENNFEFPPSHTIFLSTNHKPIIKGTDHGIWRRLRLVPFAVTIAKEQQDKDLTNKLMAEHPAILRWAVAGCLEWQANGKDLKAPEEVLVATREYRDESDSLGAFIQEFCNVGTKDQYISRASSLYAAWQAYCKSRGDYACNQTAFGLKLTDRGFEKEKPTGGPNKNKVVYYGISLDNYACEALFRTSTANVGDDSGGDTLSDEVEAPF